MLTRQPAFVKCLRALRSARIPLSWWNVRAAWRQTGLAPVDYLDSMTDEEWERYMESFS